MRPILEGERDLERVTPPYTRSLGDRIVVGITRPGLEEDELAVDRRGEELDRHVRLGALTLGEGDADFVEAGLTVFAGLGCGDCEVLGHIDFLSFSMQTNKRDRPDRLSGGTLHREEWARSAQGKVLLEGSGLRPADGPGPADCIKKKTKGDRVDIGVLNGTATRKRQSVLHASTKAVAYPQTRGKTHPTILAKARSISGAPA